MTNLNKAVSPILIQSVDNPRVKEWLALQTSSGRYATQTFLAEGDHLVYMAHQHHFIREIIIVDATPLPPEFKEYPRTWVSEKVMKKISQLVTPVTIIALCSMHPSTHQIGDHVLLLDGIQDPGNLGSILRSAVAFGVTHVVCSPTTVDPYNDKVVRASQGAIFALSLERTSLSDVIVNKRKQHLLIVTALHDTALSTKDYRFPKQWMLMVGNEGAGVSPMFVQQANVILKLPMQAEIESLNVSVATAIVLYLAYAS